MKQKEADKIIKQAKSRIGIIQSNTGDKVGLKSFTAFINSLVSEDEPGDSVKRRWFQKIKYSKEPDFVMLRKEIAKRMYSEWELAFEQSNKTIIQLPDGFLPFPNWLNKEDQ